MDDDFGLSAAVEMRLRQTGVVVRVQILKGLPVAVLTGKQHKAGVDLCWGLWGQVNWAVEAGKRSTGTETSQITVTCFRPL